MGGAGDLGCGVVCIHWDFCSDKVDRGIQFPGRGRIRINYEYVKSNWADKSEPQMTADEDED